MPEQSEQLNIKGDYTVEPLPFRLPRPTVWPAALSLAVTLLAFGIVSHWIMSLAGFILFLCAAWGWMEELRYDQLQ